MEHPELSKIKRLLWGDSMNFWGILFMVVFIANIAGSFVHDLVLSFIDRDDDDDWLDDWLDEEEREDD